MTVIENLLAQAGVAPAKPAPSTIERVDLALDLLDYQSEAVDFLLAHGGGYCALDMGMGKTPVGIAVAAACQAAGIRTVLLVPPSLTINWQREIARFAPWLSSAIVSGRTVLDVEGRRPPQSSDVPSTDVVIVPMSVAAQWADALAQSDLNALVIDEAHRCKTKGRGVTKAAQTIAQAVTGPRVLMSGTPAPNGRIREYEAQFDVLGEMAWSAIGRGAFWTHYQRKTGRFTWEQFHEQEFHEAMSAFTIRRRRDPNKDRMPVPIPMTTESWAEYEAVERDLIAALADKGYDRERLARIERAEALLKIGHLRRIAGRGKVDGIVEFVERLLDQQDGGVFVVAENVDVMDTLTLRLARHGVSMIRGGMSTADKMAEADAFNSGRSRVMVGQVDAAGVGFTLTGGGRNHEVVVAQLPWTPAQLRQAEDRLDRITQTERVTVHVMLATDPDGEGWSVDERLFGILDLKYRSASTLDDGIEDTLLDAVEDSLLATYGG